MMDKGAVLMKLPQFDPNAINSFFGSPPVS